MIRLLLVHWHAAECAARAEALREAGYAVDTHWSPDDGKALTQALRADPPAALVIDLGRLPSHGRAIATWLRERQTLRHVPLVFVPGDAAKTARLRAAFPDAAYLPWSQLVARLPAAIAAAPAEPIRPVGKDYSGTPLPQKLGVKPGVPFVALRAPAEFVQALGALPDGVTLGTRLCKGCHVVVLFCRARAELAAGFPKAQAALAAGGALWVAWPKRASGVTTDLTEDVVREVGLGDGLVDTKVCSIDGTWSGLRFSHRKQAARRA